MTAPILSRPPGWLCPVCGRFTPAPSGCNSVGGDHRCAGCACVVPPTRLRCAEKSARERARARKYARNYYHTVVATNPVSRQKVNARSRERYATDTSYRARTALRWKERYTKVAEFRAHLRARSLARRSAPQMLCPLALADCERVAQVYAQAAVGDHVDHGIPLNGIAVSGLHVAANLQVLSADKNLSKHNRCAEASDDHLSAAERKWLRTYRAARQAISYECRKVPADERFAAVKARLVAWLDANPVAGGAK